MTSIAEQKKQLRKRMRALRLVADQKEGPNVARAIVGHCMAALDDLGIGPGTVVAGYWPIVTEVDVRPLLARLGERGAICALPVVTVPDAELEFRRWHPLDDLEPGPLATAHPGAAAPVAIPEVLLVPLLAVDEDGFRLGQGGGYYDRTLAALRANGPIKAVGVGFSLQRIAHVPRESFDQPLDWVLTEECLARVTR
jgi:5-formyltetrahydrofolate cyclo-ligase